MAGGDFKKFVGNGIQSFHRTPALANGFPGCPWQGRCHTWLLRSVMAEVQLIRHHHRLGSQDVSPGLPGTACTRGGLRAGVFV